jgi:L-ascorbate metabolism protein UlaG (beta-lactamase superfamily)
MPLFKLTHSNLKLLFSFFFVLSTSASSTDLLVEKSNHFDGRHFFNQPLEPDMQSAWKVWWYYFTTPRVDAVPENPLPIQKLEWATWNALPADKVHVVRLGHSSLLLKLHGQQWLIDPVFSERASPLSFIGPKRFHPLPIDVDNMPMIDGVIISHDHYDHLDAGTIKRIYPKVKQFVTPLGVGKILKDFGVPAEKIKELDWHQSAIYAGVKLTAEPAQHFSGRGLFDRNTTLWASWVIESQVNADPVKIFYSSDSGYFEGFKKIGAKHGPFDLTMIDTGAWDKMWASIHMNPEESVQTHLDVQGKVMMPVHNSTFDLALHPWYEPLELVSAIGARQQVLLATPMMGEVYVVGSVPSTNPWWRNHMRQHPVAQ